jgi:hypothetical protein
VAAITNRERRDHNGPRARRRRGRCDSHYGDRIPKDDQIRQAAEGVTDQGLPRAPGTQAFRRRCLRASGPGLLAGSDRLSRRRTRDPKSGSLWQPQHWQPSRCLNVSAARPEGPEARQERSPSDGGQPTFRAGRRRRGLQRGLLSFAQPLGPADRGILQGWIGAVAGAHVRDPFNQTAARRPHADSIPREDRCDSCPCPPQDEADLGLRAQEIFMPNGTTRE